MTIDTGVAAVKIGHITKSVEVWTNDRNSRMITLIVAGDVLPPDDEKK